VTDTPNEQPCTPQPSDVFPPEVRDALVKASQVKEPHMRRIAIDGAIDWARAAYPQCFKPE